MQNNTLRYVAIAALITGAFLGAYSFASARGNGGTAADAAPFASTGVQTASNTGGADSSSPACACCGSTAPTEGGVTGDRLEGDAKVTGDVQKIDVDLSSGSYQPNVITLKSGVPAEITFGQSSGCTAQVVSSELGFSEDLTGGPRTVTIENPEPGEYTFSCGMEMVFGKIVVQ